MGGTENCAATGLKKYHYLMAGRPVVRVPHLVCLTTTSIYLACAAHPARRGAGARCEAYARVPHPARGTSTTGLR
jgi:hypothetical protein